MPRPPLPLLLLLALPAALATGSQSGDVAWTDATGPQDVDVSALPIVSVPAPQIDIVDAELRQTSAGTTLRIRVVDLDARVTPEEGHLYLLSFRGNGCPQGGVIQTHRFLGTDAWIAGYACFDGENGTWLPGTAAFDHAADIVTIEVAAPIFTTPAKGRIATLACPDLATGCGWPIPFTFSDATTWTDISWG